MRSTNETRFHNECHLLVKCYNDKTVRRFYEQTSSAIVLYYTFAFNKKIQTKIVASNYFHLAFFIAVWKKKNIYKMIESNERFHHIFQNCLCDFILIKLNLQLSASTHWTDEDSEKKKLEQNFIYGKKQAPTDSMTFYKCISLFSNWPRYWSLKGFQVFFFPLRSACQLHIVPHIQNHIRMKKMQIECTITIQMHQDMPIFTCKIIIYPFTLASTTLCLCTSSSK